MEEQVFETTEDVKVINSFDDMGLKEDLIRGIYAYSIQFLTRF
jgi:ATP-dependent RNA helicase